MRSASVTAALINAQWKFLDPQRPSHHVEAVRQLWNVHAISAQHHIVESTIISLMLEATKGTLNTSVLSTPIEHFATLLVSQLQSWLSWRTATWTLDHSPLTVLDLECAKQWLRGAPATSLIDIYKVAFIPLTSATSTQGELLVSMKRISDILSSQSDDQWAKFAGDKSLQIDVKDSSSQETTASVSGEEMHINLRVENMIRAVQMMALKLLRQSLGRGYKDLDLDSIETFLLTRLEYSITKNRHHNQGAANGHAPRLDRCKAFYGHQ